LTLLRPTATRLVLISLQLWLVLPKYSLYHVSSPKISMYFSPPTPAPYASPVSSFSFLHPLSQTPRKKYNKAPGYAIFSILPPFTTSPLDPNNLFSTLYHKRPEVLKHGYFLRLHKHNGRTQTIRNTKFWVATPRC
jgi:hypothetical protein